MQKYGHFYSHELVHTHPCLKMFLAQHFYLGIKKIQTTFNDKINILHYGQKSLNTATLPFGWETNWLSPCMVSEKCYPCE